MKINCIWGYEHVYGIETGVLFSRVVQYPSSLKPKLVKPNVDLGIGSESNTIVKE